MVFVFGRYTYPLDSFTAQSHSSSLERHYENYIWVYGRRGGSSENPGEITGIIKALCCSNTRHNPNSVTGRLYFLIIGSKRRFLDNCRSSSVQNTKYYTSRHRTEM